MPTDRLRIMVLAGGPDQERPVSLISGEQVAAALQQRGHDVRLRDILPDNLSALDDFQQWDQRGGDVLFLAMHGAWGEGGGLQQILEERHLPYVGCGPDAAARCMDKHATKLVLLDHGLPTPPSELVDAGSPLTLRAPLVLKPLREGSSIGIAICRDDATAQARKQELAARYGQLLVEQFIDGLELTCGVIGGGAGGAEEALPPVQIVPATGFYDYEAKYTRDDTRYVFDALPLDTLKLLQKLSLKTHKALDCRHLSRVDFMVDRDGRPWILEVNTIPGFTSHSLVPKSAAQAGIDFPTLCDRLARLGVRR